MPRKDGHPLQFPLLSGYKTGWEKFFEDDYDNRIRAIHPDSRFGAEAIPQFLADDLKEAKRLLGENQRSTLLDAHTKTS